MRQFLETKKPFVDCNITEISEIMKTGKVPASWKVGDSKMIGDVKITIIDFNTDRYADGKVAPVTFMGQLTGRERMDPNWSVKNEWDECELRKRLQPGGDLFEELPEKLREHIVPTVRYTGSGHEKCSRKVVETRDYLWLFSEVEVFGRTEYSTSKEEAYYEQHTFFKKPENRVLKDRDRNPIRWWLRSSPVLQNGLCFVNGCGNNCAIASYAFNSVVFGFLFK